MTERKKPEPARDEGTRGNNRATFQKGNKLGRKRKAAVDGRMVSCLLEGLRLSEQAKYESETRRRLLDEGEEAEAVNKVLAELDDLTGDEVLIRFWKSVNDMGTDASKKIIAERLMPKAKLPAVVVGSANMSREDATAKISKMMVAGLMPPDVAQSMISALNGVAEMEERALLIKIAELQIQAAEKGLLDQDGDE